ncbi:MAG: MotA/TolQ/ExbB proton channel family protein [Planctomycetota bacterium]|nr:MAG: MotA/TolQ/ExbB proton channel family protein [Planctomycetota bacterium]
MRYFARVRWHAALLIGAILFGAAFGPPAGTVLVQTAYAQDADAADAEAVPEKSALRFYYDALGPVYTVVFLSLSFVFVALIVMNIMAIRRQSVVPPDLVASFEAMLNEKRFQDAYELARNDESFLGHVLAAGLAKLQEGYPQAVEAMQEVGEDENMRLEQRLSYIALIGTVSPMIGLLGTVNGMVLAFQQIARTNTQPKPSVLAGSISMALITTLIGLMLAIPAIAAFGIFRNRLQRLVLEVGIFSERLMSRFQNVGPKKMP